MPITDYVSYSRAAFEGQFIPQYGESAFFGIQGQLKNNQPLTVMEGRIPYGRLVVVNSRGNAGEYNVSLPTEAPGEQPIGISIALDTHTKKYRTSETYDPISNTFQIEAGIPSGKKLTVMRKGLVWVFSETELLPGADVGYRNNNVLPNSNQSLGRFSAYSNVVGTVYIPYAKVVRPCINPLGGFALIHVDIPMV